MMRLPHAEESMTIR